MISIKEHVARHRRSLRAVALLCVLLLCVAVAQLLVEYKSTGSRQGAAVLAEIRSKGLQKYLPAQKTQYCYLITAAGGRPLGWRVIFIQPEKDGAFSGGCVWVSNESTEAEQIYVSHWELDKNAMTGKYESQTFLRNSLTQEIDETQTVLTAKEVKLDQRINGERMEASSLRPANYIPEDVQCAAMFQLVKNKTDACFKVIYDNIPSEGAAVPFITLRCSYEGEKDGLLRLATRSNLDSSSTEDSIVCFDKLGRMVKVLEPDGQAQSLTDMETLKMIFPNSARIIKTLVGEK